MSPAAAQAFAARSASLASWEALAAASEAAEAQAFAVADQHVLNAATHHAAADDEAPAIAASPDRDEAAAQLQRLAKQHLAKKQVAAMRNARDIGERVASTSERRAVAARYQQHQASNNDQATTISQTIFRTVAMM